MDHTLVCKSTQEVTLDLRPVFHAAPGVDLPSVIVSCIPFLPDGSNVWAAVDFATWFDFFLSGRSFLSNIYMFYRLHNGIQIHWLFVCLVSAKRPKTVSHYVGMR
jgi:hypothetical protein